MEQPVNGRSQTALTIIEPATAAARLLLLRWLGHVVRIDDHVQPLRRLDVVPNQRPRQRVEQV